MILNCECNIYSGLFLPMIGTGLAWKIKNHYRTLINYGTVIMTFETIILRALKTFKQYMSPTCPPPPHTHTHKFETIVVLRKSLENERKRTDRTPPLSGFTGRGLII